MLKDSICIGNGSFRKAWQDAPPSRCDFYTTVESGRKQKPLQERDNKQLLMQMT